MGQVQRQITISAPAKTVFGYLADFPRHAEWAAHRLQLQQTSEGPIGVGTTFACTGHMMGRDSHDQVTITEFVPDSKIVFEADGDTGKFRHFLVLQEEGEGTRFTKGFETLQSRFPFSLIAPVLGPLLFPRAIDGDLKRIKANLEGEATA